MQRSGWVPPGVDTERPSASRIYDYMLGGSHHFAADRLVAERAIAAMPQLPGVLRENRMFLRRAVRFLALQTDIDQFLDLGSGIPTVGNVHDIAAGVDPSARVVYVDIDPIAVAHSRALLAGNPRADALVGDLEHPARLLTEPLVRDLLDLTRPVAVLLVAALHFVADDDRAARVLAELRGALAPGSHVAISHASSDGRPPKGHLDAQEVYARANNEITMRSLPRIAALLDGWEILPPGIVRCPLWQPEPGDASPDDPNRFPGYSVVARLPG